MALNDNHDDDLERDPQLARLYQAAAGEEPPAALDAAILAAADVAVHSDGQLLHQRACLLDVRAAAIAADNAAIGSVLSTNARQRARILMQASTSTVPADVQPLKRILSGFSQFRPCHATMHTLTTLSRNEPKAARNEREIEG